MRKTLNIFIILTIICFNVFLFLYCFFAIKYPSRFNDEIRQVSKSVGVDENLIKAVCCVESRFDQNAQSRAGAIGVMQLLPETAIYVCDMFEIDEEIDLFNAKDNILIGSLYLKYLQGRFVNQNTMLASYNAGEGNVVNWLQNANFSDDGTTLKHIPFKETRSYIKKVNKAINFYKKQ